jgi:hypothetical protein
LQGAYQLKIRNFQDNLKVLRWRRPFKLVRGRRSDPEHSAGARKPKPSIEAEEFSKEKVTEIITKEPEFEMPGEDTKISQLKPRYF